MPRSTQATATYDDVNLIMRLFDLRREEKLRAARDWFGANCKPKNFEGLMKTCPPGSPESGNFRMVVGYWDMAASFITCGVLSQDLFFESNRELLLVWERIKPAIAGLRDAFKDPNMFKNMETVATDYVEWLKARSPGAYEAFLANVVK